MKSSETPSFRGQALRPSEKVLHFFEAQQVEALGKSGARLPTIKEIAQHLDVGISTVQTVFARLSNEGKVITIPGKGTFLGEKAQEAALASSAAAVTVFIREHQLNGKESTWGKEICASMLCEASNNSEREMTLRLFFPSGEDNAPQLLDQEAQKAAGAIVFPDPMSAQLTQPFEALGKPVVSITPCFPRSTGNFVAPDFYGVCEKIGRTWRQIQRKHVAMLLHMPLAQSATCTLSLAGLQAGLQGAKGITTARFSYYSVDNEKPEVNKMMEMLYARKPYPDAIYSSGDFIAAKAVQWLLDRGMKVPDDVSVIGGTGLHPAHDALLPCTVIQQPFEALGQEAIRMLVERLRSGNAPLPGRYIGVAIRAGRTTTEEENRIFSASDHKA